MKIIWIAALMFLLCSCNSGVSIHELPDFEYDAKEKEYEYVWFDDEVPADFEASEDYLYLNFDIDGDTWVYRVNPYSLRVSLICSDPLCGHDIRSCPYYGYPYLKSDVVSDGENVYFFGGQHKYSDVYDGSVGKMIKIDSSAVGLNAYNVLDGKISELVGHENFYEYGVDFDIEYDDGWIYYYCEVPIYEDGKEVKKDNGKALTETRLYRIRNDGKEQIEDLGLYKGYTELVIRDGYIWNYYGFFNESDVWENVGQNDIVRTDMNNENPTVIPCVSEPVDDADGYWLPFSGSPFLIYSGKSAEPHVWRYGGKILYYDAGGIWTADIQQDEWEENGIIKSNQTGVNVYRKNIISGECELIENPPLPEDAVYFDAAAVVDGRYVIYTVYGLPESGGGYFLRLYYLRLDTQTGEVYPIYP